MESKLETYLGFAAKAGKLKFGMAKTEESAAKRKSKLIIIANDISEKSKKEMLFTANKYGVTAVVLSCTSELEKATGSHGSVISVEDESFAKAVIERLNSLKEI